MLHTVARAGFAHVEARSVQVTPPPKAAVCNQCGKVFKHARNIKRHYQVLHQMYVLPCEHCSECFSRSDKLRAHMRDRHGIGEKLVCRSCKQHFPGDIYLEKHYADTGH